MARIPKQVHDDFESDVSDVVETNSVSSMRSTRSHRGFFFGFIVVILIGLAISVVAGSGGLFSGLPGVDSNKWQAVFLDNNQVYFGKLSSAGKGYAKLENIFYLRASQALQQGSDQQTGPELSLVRLGAELHGPEDTMYIPKQKILFWENMKNDSQVVSAITNFLNSSATR